MQAEGTFAEGGILNTPDYLCTSEIRFRFSLSDKNLQICWSHYALNLMLPTRLKNIKPTAPPSIPNMANLVPSGWRKHRFLCRAH
jgi:hypothetical protein